MRRIAPLFVAAAAALAACSDQVPLAPEARVFGGAQMHVIGPNDQFVPGQIVVRFKEEASHSEVAARHRGRKKQALRLARTEVIEVSVGEELATAARMNVDPDVEWAEPDYVVRLEPCETSTECNLPDGTFFFFKWDLNNTGSILDNRPGQGLIITGKADADIDWVELYDLLGPSFEGSATVGVMDTGIRPTHPMFAGKIIAGQRFLNDGVAITNFIDDNGHGSHTAGIAAGRAVALAPAALPAVSGVGYGANIKLLVAKVCNSDGLCPQSATANGIVWAADNGANVINLSLGGFGGAPDAAGSALQQAALQYAVSRNVLPVCATGNNDGQLPPNPPYTGGVSFPARFPECMAVAATDWGDTKASYSNYGAQVAVSAPGGDTERIQQSRILSASAAADNSYAFAHGTSMATPQVAGLAALLYASGYTDPAAVRQRIIETVDDVEAPGWDPRTGFGRINAYRAVTGRDPNAPPVANAGGTYSGNKGVTVTFDGSASFDPNFKPVTFAWDFGDPTSSSNTSSDAQPTHTFLRAGTYTVGLTVTDAALLTNSVTTTAIIPNIIPALGFTGATILQGETYSTSASFIDADPDEWTATVDYGDGSGVLALALADKSFSLSHRYIASGDKTVSVAVSDNDGGTGSNTAVVTVWTPQQGIKFLLLTKIHESGLDLKDRIKLGAPLVLAALELEKGKAKPSIKNKIATGLVELFIKSVQHELKKKDIDPALAAALIADANRVIASINR